MLVSDFSFDLPEELIFDVNYLGGNMPTFALNFSRPLITWRRADVKQLRYPPQHELVLANLYSDLLIETAPGIVRAVTPGGDLWLSGILREQKAEVIAAYRKQGLRLARATTRGKWVMLQLQK